MLCYTETEKKRKADTLAHCMSKRQSFGISIGAYGHVRCIQTRCELSPGCLQIMNGSPLVNRLACVSNHYLSDRTVEINYKGSSHLFLACCCDRCCCCRTSLHVTVKQFNVAPYMLSSRKRSTMNIEVSAYN